MGKSALLVGGGGGAGDVCPLTLFACGIISGRGCCILLALTKLEVRSGRKSSASPGGGECGLRCEGLKQALAEPCPRLHWGVKTGLESWSTNLGPEGSPSLQTEELLIVEK